MSRRIGPWRRRAGLLALLAIGAAAAACEPPPTPDPAGSPRTSAAPGDGGPGVEDVAAALDALDDLGSYRFTVSITEDVAGAPDEVRGVVVNGEPRRSRVEFLAGGAFAGGQVTIGDRQWTSVAGADYREQEAVDGLRDAPNPVAQQLDPWALGVDGMADLGTEVQGGVEARRLQASIRPEDAVDEEGFPIGLGFSGVVDAWIAVDGGWLVAARASGVQAWPAASDGEPAPPASPYSLEVLVAGVDDPANAVDEPAAAPGSPPPGDPEAEALIRRLPRAQGRLDRYVVRVTATTGGVELGGRLVVTNRPRTAARLEVDAIAGFEPTELLVAGSRAWTRTGAGSWRRDDGATCGAGFDAILGDDGTPCTFERLTEVTAGLDGIAATFTIVEAEARAAGIPSTHLRSEAGLVQGDTTIPGTTDVWIATNGGYLVKQVFTGDGVSSSAVIDRVNDPALEVEVPER